MDEQYGIFLAIIVISGASFCILIVLGEWAVKWVKNFKNKNMSDKSSSSSSGIGFTGLLGVAFIVLKLCGVINWSWFWVLSPLWVGVAIVILFLCIAGIIILIEDIQEKNKRKRIDATKPKWQQRR